MLKELKKVDLYNDGIGYVSLIDVSEVYKSAESRKQFIADCAAVTRGKDESSNVDATFNRLLKENCGEKGRPFEFCPAVVFNANKTIPAESVNRYRHQFVENGKIYTTARSYICGEVSKEDLAKFVVIKGRVPRFVYTHLATHTQLSTMCQTSRLNLAKKKEFYMMKDASPEIQDIIRRATTECKHVAKVLGEVEGITPEIANRFLPQTEYVDFIMSGWVNDEEAWNHFIELRTGSWTQQQTKEVAEAIKHLVGYSQRDPKTDGIELGMVTAEEFDVNNPILEKFLDIYKIPGVKTCEAVYTLKTMEQVAKELHITIPQCSDRGEESLHYSKLYRTCVAVIQLRNI